MSSTGPSNKSRYVALGAVSALGLLALGGQSVSANSVVVKPGDTVWGIANQYATTKSALETANPNSIKKISSSIDLIQAGQSLVLPNTGNAQVAQSRNQTNTYLVKRGDTLSAIAKKFGVTVNQLMAWNHLTNADRIQVGQVLIVSGDPNASVPVNNAAASATVVAPTPAATTNTNTTAATTTTTATSAVSVQAAATPVANQPVANDQNAGVSQPQPATNNNVSETASTRAVYAAAYTRTSYQPVSQAQTTQVSAAVAQPASANTQQPVSQATTQITTQQVPVNNNTDTNSDAINDQLMVVNNQTNQAANTQVNQQSQAFSQATVNVVPAQSSASQSVSSAAIVQSSVAAQNNQSAQNTQNQNNNTNGGVIFVDNNSQTTPSQPSNTGSVVSLAVKLANSNIPYVWGGNSLSGMDCSGLVDYVYLNATGKQLPHYTVALENCVYQKPVSQAQAGDLLFWGNHGATYHTAIYIGNNQYVAAPEPGENVQVQTISQYFMPSFAGTVK